MMPELISQRSVIVRNHQGLHMRPADLLVKAAMKFQSAQLIDGKSILGILTLGAQAGSTLHLRAIGEDSSDAIQVLGDLFDNCFYETNNQTEAAK
jgi:phosphotransferase system HPr (HPr) family protein